MTTLVTVVAEMKAKPGKEDALRKALLAMVEATRKEAGCVQYDLHEHLNEPGRFVFYENWESAENLNSHSASEHLKAFRAVSGDLVDGPMSVQRYQRIA